MFSDRMGEPLRLAVLGYLDSLETGGAMKPTDRLSKPDLSVLDGLDTSKFVGTQWNAVYDALSLAISGISGIGCQPRCEESPHVLNPAGDYLDYLSEFLINERERLIKNLHIHQPSSADESTTRASLLVRYEAECGELNMTAMAAYALSLATPALSGRIA